MSQNTTLVVRVEVIGHASPRYKSAKSDKDADVKNQILSEQRARNVFNQLKTDLQAELEALGHKLRFIENITFNRGDQPENSVVVNNSGRGSQDSRQSTGNDRTNEDPKYRRVDINVHIARATQESVPKKVIVPYKQETKTKFWRLHLGFNAAVGAVVDFSFTRCALSNMWQQVAEGSIVTAGAGLGVAWGGGKSIKGSGSGDGAVRAGVLPSMNSADFTTAKPVDFSDFHGSAVSLSQAGIVIYKGYTTADVQFPFNKHVGPQIIHVSGFDEGLEINIQGGLGILVLDTVPPGYILTEYDTYEWDTVRTDWYVSRFNQIKFDRDVSSLNASQLSDIMLFSQEVATDANGG